MKPYVIGYIAAGVVAVLAVVIAARLGRRAGRRALQQRLTALSNRLGVEPPDEGTVLDLVAVLTAGRDAAPATAHRAAARWYIEEHLARPDLGAEQIAAAIGLSERQLSRVFAADGTSVPRHVLARRLHLAYSMLAANPAAKPGASPGGHSDGTVADVAARCGFTSAAYFSHAFRQHFGVRASDVRGQFRDSGSLGAPGAA